MSTLFHPPIVYLITAGHATPENFKNKSVEILYIIRTAVECGVTLIQIREKHLTAKMLFELASEAAKITVNSNSKLLINDRIDIALAARTDGVHLSVSSMPVRMVKEKFGKELVVGVSTHTLEAARTAARDGADFIVFGPVFASPGKGEPAGLEPLAAVCRETAPLSVLGLGGIDAGNYRSVLATGASGIAAIRMLNDLDILSQIMTELVQ